MDELLESIELDLDESNELLFKVKVEGADNKPTKVRLVCESGDLAYMFNGHSISEPDVVQFQLPSMKDKLKEGNYTSRVEVLVDNRYFTPVKFNINFKKVVSVVAEAVSLPTVRKAPTVISVTAAPIVVQKPVATAETPKPGVVTPIAKKQVATTPTKPTKSTTQSSSLRDRYTARVDESVIDAENVDEELIREIFSELSKKSKKR